MVCALTFISNQYCCMKREAVVSFFHHWVIFHRVNKPYIVYPSSLTFQLLSGFAYK